MKIAIVIIRTLLGLIFVVFGLNACQNTLYLLYEITVWIAWYWDRQEKNRAVRES